MVCELAEPAGKPEPAVPDWFDQQLNPHMEVQCFTNSFPPLNSLLIEKRVYIWYMSVIDMYGMFTQQDVKKRTQNLSYRIDLIAAHISNSWSGSGVLQSAL